MTPSLPLPPPSSTFHSNAYSTPIFLTSSSCAPNLYLPKCVTRHFQTSLPLPKQSIIKPPILATIPSPSSSFSSSSSNLRHVPVRGDGRCLFRAIAKNLARLDGRSLPEHLERADADYLRNLAWTIICKRRRSEFQRRQVIEGSMSAYCAASNHPTFYAGEAELLALAEELKIPIAVYLRVKGGGIRNIMTYGEQFKQKRQKEVKKHQQGDASIRLLYVNGNHYDALLPR